jgi:U3 small nucleolar RNA-associated protein 3
VIVIHIVKTRDIEASGDDDIPYRERKKEKEARVRREVEKTRGEGGDDLDTGIGNAEDPEGASDLGIGKRKRQDDGHPSDEEGEDGYYELVKRAKKEKKEGKKREYEEARMKERFAKRFSQVVTF